MVFDEERSNYKEKSNEKYSSKKEKQDTNILKEGKIEKLAPPLQIEKPNRDRNQTKGRYLERNKKNFRSNKDHELNHRHP